MEQEIIDKIGKRSILADDIRLDYKLTYIGGIDSFDAHFSDGSKEKERNRILVSKYPKGLLFRIDTRKPIVNYGLSYESINDIRVESKSDQQNKKHVTLYTTEADIYFELKSADLNQLKEFVEYFSKHLKTTEPIYDASQHSGFEQDNEAHQLSDEGVSQTNRYRYPALRTIAGVYMTLAYIIGALSVIAMFIFLARESILEGVLFLVGGGLLALGLAAISESIKVFLDIEYNTRVGAMRRNS